MREFESMPRGGGTGGINRRKKTDPEKNMFKIFVHNN